MSSIARFMERRKREEGISFEKARSGTAPIYCFPNSFVETAEAAKCLAKIHMDVLPFAGSIFPDCRCRNGLGSQANRGRSAITEWAWHDRILSVESKFASAVRGRHSDIFQHFIYAAIQVEIRSSRGIAQFRLKRLRECFSGFFVNWIQSCSSHVHSPFEVFLLVMLSGIQPATMCCRIG
jgi:hypothetical protein